MFIGPVFTRELAITPRRGRVYVARAAYVTALLGLICVAWLMLTGTQVVRDLGDLARFGTLMFRILVPLQLVVGLFFAALLSASAVSQEKDRKTLILLLLTNLSNSELVLGKLLASLLNVFILAAAAVPLFMVTVLLGGVSFGQVGMATLVTFAGVMVAGSLGSTIALWREKTFQSLAMTVMILVLWIAFWEVIGAGLLGQTWFGVSCESLAIVFSPWRAAIETTFPIGEAVRVFGFAGSPVWMYLLLSAIELVLINGLAIALVRVWNPSRETQPISPEETTETGMETDWNLVRDKAKAEDTSKPSVDGPGSKATSKTRPVWDNPIIWREIRTWAYGRKILVIRFIYLVLAALAALAVWWMLQDGATFGRTQGALALVPLFLLSLFLINAQAVTSLTSERDTRALDLLLVTDLTPKEIVFGKLGGVFYNTKEMLIAPILLCVFLWWQGTIGLENLVYLLGGFIVLGIFVAMLGVHAGMNYFNTRTAVATSLGTLFFLFVGVGVCMRMMIAFSGSFNAQMQPFLAFTIGGGIGLYVALGARNPSTAIGFASFICPFATFYAITSFLLDYTLGVFLVTALAYGFMTAAMMVPAIYEFDVATGRTTSDDE